MSLQLVYSGTMLCTPASALRGHHRATAIARADMAYGQEPPSKAQPAAGHDLANRSRGSAYEKESRSSTNSVPLKTDTVSCRSVQARGAKLPALCKVLRRQLLPGYHDSYSKDSLTAPLTLLLK